MLGGESLPPLSAEALHRGDAVAAERGRDGRGRGRARCGPYAAASCCGSRAASSWPGPTWRWSAQGLSRLTDATLEATLDIAMESVRARSAALDAAPTRMAIIAMGRYGGFELSYGSDADVMFVHEPVDGVEPQVATSYAQAVVAEVRRLLSLPASDPPLEVDADLRPEGKQGPLVRTLESYAAYYAKWSHVWEFQALLRADAVVGDEDLRGAVHRADRPAALPRRGDHRRTTSSRCAGSRRASTTSGCRAAPTRTPTSSSAAAGWPTSSGPSSCCRCGTPGTVAGAAHAADPAPRSTAAAEAELIAADDAETLAEAWRLVSRVRNAVTLVRGKPADQLPRDARERAAVAQRARLPAGRRPTRWSTTTSAPPGGRTRWSSGSSGNEAICFIQSKRRYDLHMDEVKAKASVTRHR